MIVSVEFRGGFIDVEIDHDGGFERDTNAHVIDWHISDMDPREEDALHITDEEMQAIYEQLCTASESGDYDYVDERD